jgi:hypothetical protein
MLRYQLEFEDDRFGARWREPLRVRNLAAASAAATNALKRSSHLRSVSVFDEGMLIMSVGPGGAESNLLG